MSLTREQIVETVTGIVTRELGVDPATLTSDTDLRVVEGADSVKVLRMIAKIEREYDIELEDSDVFGLNSIADVADVVEEALSVRRA